MIVQVHLTSQTEQVLREKAARRGQTLADYVAALADREAVVGPSRAAPAGADLREFERDLDALAEELPALPALPAQLGRADVYDEHA